MHVPEHWPEDERDQISKALDILRDPECSLGDASAAYAVAYGIADRAAAKRGAVSADPAADQACPECGVSFLKFRALAEQLEAENARLTDRRGYWKALATSWGDEKDRLAARVEQLEANPKGGVHRSWPCKGER